MSDTSELTDLQKAGPRAMLLNWMGDTIRTPGSLDPGHDSAPSRPFWVRRESVEDACRILCRAVFSDGNIPSTISIHDEEYDEYHTKLTLGIEDLLDVRPDLFEPWRATPEQRTKIRKLVDAWAEADRYVRDLVPSLRPMDREFLVTDIELEAAGTAGTIEDFEDDHDGGGQVRLTAEDVLEEVGVERVEGWREHTVLQN